jgi:hypothetical protein
LSIWIKNDQRKKKPVTLTPAYSVPEIL